MDRRTRVPKLNVTSILRIFFLVVIPSRTSYLFLGVVPRHTRLSSIVYVTRRKVYFEPNFLLPPHNILFTIIWVTATWLLSEGCEILSYACIKSCSSQPSIQFVSFTITSRLMLLGGGKFVFIMTSYATLCVHCVEKTTADRSATAGVTRSCHWSSKG
jgi:hypothetical protein